MEKDDNKNEEDKEVDKLFPKTKRSLLPFSYDSKEPKPLLSFHKRSLLEKYNISPIFKEDLKAQKKQE